MNAYGNVPPSDLTYDEVLFGEKKREAVPVAAASMTTAPPEPPKVN